MDRTTPILVSFASYSFVALLFSKFIYPPNELKRKEQKDYLGQHLSIIHAYMAIMICSAVYIYEGGIDYNAPTNMMHVVAIGNSLGYFIFDSIYAEYYKLHDGAMRFHHVFALIALFTMYFSSIGGSASVVGLWLTEISNPCVLKRHILRAKGEEESFTYNLYENLFIFLFIAGRILCGTWYLYKVWKSEINWMYKLMSSSVYSVTWFWIFVIITKALKKYSGAEDPSMKRLLSIVRYLRQNKAVLLAFILFVSFVVPTLLTQVLEIDFLRFEVDGFKVM
ncbi:hypothetical protein SteCoe_21581 [Stentor coeruleus]|uniref:TLC domain-containing protein n=1 Tax=Stentor coeruleus TaxID=5963 RepID=A0A1R2BNZ8_9CILI|nr:hypothetical protein SteCoe_21581 [Stentor coeruleus]